VVRQQRLQRRLLQQLKQPPTRTELRSWLHCTVQQLRLLLLVVRDATSDWLGSCRRVQLGILLECSCPALAFGSLHW
jgi:hypothetical protein